MLKKFCFIFVILLFSPMNSMQKKLLALRTFVKNKNKVEELKLHLVAKNIANFIKLSEALLKFYTSKKMQEKMKEFILKGWGTDYEADLAQGVTVDQALERYQHFTKQSLRAMIQFLKEMQALVVDKKILIETPKNMFEQVYQEMKKFVMYLRKIAIKGETKDTEPEEDITEIENQIEDLQKNVYLLYLKEVSRKKYTLKAFIERNSIIEKLFDAAVEASIYKINAKFQSNFFYISSKELANDLINITQKKYNIKNASLNEIKIFNQTSSRTIRNYQIYQEFYPLDLVSITHFEATFHSFSPPTIEGNNATPSEE